jgi:6-phosphogluconolactonase (cycloisomerase 2 family)
VYSSNEVFGISHVALPTVTAVHDGSPVHFTVTPALPAGLALDTHSGAISGTPTAPAPRAVYDVEVANSAGSVHALIGLRVVAPSRFLISTSAADNSFSCLAADTFSGEVRRLGQVITGAGETGPEMLVVHPTGRFAYAPNLGSSNITVFSVDPTSGWFDLRAPVACGLGPHNLVIDPTGRFAYVANQGSNEINSYAINPANGDLTPIAGPLGVGSQPAALVVDPTGKYLFAAMHGSDPIGMGSEVVTFAIDPTSGILTATGNLLALQGTRPLALCIDTVRPVLFVTLETIHSVLPVVFDPASGALTPGTIMAAGAKPCSIAVTESGRFVYVANSVDNTVAAFAIDPVTWQLSSVGSYPAGTAPSRVKVDPTGKFVFVSSRDSAELFTFPIDDATGELSARTSLLVRGSPVDVAVVPGDRPTTTVPRFAHAAAAFSGDVTSYSIDPATGELTQTGVVLTGDMPSAIAIDPRRRFAWVSNSFGFSLSIFSMNATTGKLSPGLPAVAVTGKPTHLIVDPSARFLYVTTHDVVSLDDGWLTTYAIDQSTGAITPLDSQQIGFNPTSVGIEPTGRFLYTANNGTGLPGTSGISVFSLDPATGIPTNSAAPATAPGVFDIAFHPNGRHLYGVLKGANAIARYTISHTTGQLTAVPPATSAGTDTVGLAITSNGKFAYSCAFDALGTGSFSAHAIAADGTLGEPMQTLSDGTHPYDIAADASCQFVYAANSGSDSLTVARIDPVTGMMTLGIPVPSGHGVGAVVVTSVTQ